MEMKQLPRGSVRWLQALWPSQAHPSSANILPSMFERSAEGHNTRNLLTKDQSLRIEYMVHILITAFVGIQAVSASEAFAAPVGNFPCTVAAHGTDTAHNTNVYAFYVVLVTVVRLMTTCTTFQRPLNRPGCRCERAMTTRFEHGEPCRSTVLAVPPAG